MREVLSNKDHEVVQLKSQGTMCIKFMNLIFILHIVIVVTELEKLQEKLILSEQELQNARYGASL